MHRQASLVYFQNEFLLLSYPERLLVKAISWGVYGLLATMAALFLFGEIERLQGAGILLFLFLFDRFFQAKYGQKQILSETARALEAGRAVNAAPYFQERANMFLEKALAHAELSHSPSTTFHLLEKLSVLPEIRKGLLRLGIAETDFRGAILAKLQEVEKAERRTYSRQALNEEVSAIASRAFLESLHFGERAVSPAAVFLGLLEARAKELDPIFSKFNFAEDDFHNAIIFGRLALGLAKKASRRPAIVAGRRRRPHRIMNRAWTARPTPFLDQVSEDLTIAARQNILGFLVGHEEEYQSLVTILNREEKNNALLVGESGVGKETIVQHAAFKITRDEVPAKLFDRRLIKLNLSAVTSGAKTAGEIQERLEQLVKEILVAGNIVLYIPDAHNLKLTSGEGLNAFEFMKPIFAASVIPTIADTTPQDYRRVIEPDSSFRTLFEPVRVEALSPEDAVRLLTYQSFVLEAKWGITIGYRAIKRAVSLAHRFLTAKPLPSSAIDLLEEALADVKRQKLEVLTEEDVANLVARKTKIPMGVAVKAEAEKLLELEKFIHERLINQEEAVKAVASAMRQYRAGLAREKGPIATFLFVGPTGVGKTELSKVLAEIYFGAEGNMIRFDMSEYQESRSIWNFIGSPDGAVRGNLTEAAKSKPFSLILLDEFEKAHRDILELFLPLFDEGRLADSAGNVIDFTNTIIICTSNAHSELVKAEIEKGTPMKDIAALLKTRLTEYFKPELLNRFDGVIAFRSLAPAEIQKIAALQITKLFKRLEGEQGIKVILDSSVPELLSRLGWNPVFGARPLRGVIREKVSEILAQRILKAEIRRGDTIAAKAAGDEVIFEKLQ